MTLVSQMIHAFFKANRTLSSFWNTVWLFAKWLLIVFLVLDPLENPVNITDPPLGVTDPPSHQWAGALFWHQR